MLPMIHACHNKTVMNLIIPRKPYETIQDVLESRSYTITDIITAFLVALYKGDIRVSGRLDIDYTSTLPRDEILWRNLECLPTVGLYSRTGERLNVSPITFNELENTQRDEIDFEQ